MWRLLLAIASAVVFMTAAPGKASAAALCVPESGQHKFIYYQTPILTAGTPYTFETANLSTGGDTVMYLMIAGVGGVPFMAAYNDDIDSTRRSKIVYTSPVPVNSWVLVRSYATGNGLTDLKINGTTVLTQNAFGSEVRFGDQWAKNDTIRVTSARRGALTEDPMLFIGSLGGALTQQDDDSGPNNNSLIVATSSPSPSMIFYGSYPTNLAAGYRLTITPANLQPDADHDGVPDSLEAACGLNPNDPDTDHDTVLDSLELYGNNGFSFAGGYFYGDAPTRRNLYIEIKSMNNANVTPPYAGLPTDMELPFLGEAGKMNHPVDPYVELEPSPSMPYNRYLSYDCGSASQGTVVNGCVTYDNLVPLFSVGMPERAFFFHKIANGDQLVTGAPPRPTCLFVGLGHYLTTQIIYGYGRSCLNPPTTVDQYRGGLLHELGHNMNLTHNNNGNPVVAQNSIIHVSIMNYRYGINGVGVPTYGNGALKERYSEGIQPMADCTVSPKKECTDAVAAAIARGEGAAGCRNLWGDPLCDQDVPEWNMVMTLDFVTGQNQGAPLGGSGQASLSQSAPAQSAFAPAFPAALAGGAEDLAALTDMEARNQGGVTATNGLKAVDNDKWVGPVPQISTVHQKAIVQAIVGDLQRRKLVLGKDFYVSTDGLSVIPIE